MFPAIVESLPEGNSWTLEDCVLRRDTANAVGEHKDAMGRSESGDSESGDGRVEGGRARTLGGWETLPCMADFKLKFATNSRRLLRRWLGNKRHYAQQTSARTVRSVQILNLFLQ